MQVSPDKTNELLDILESGEEHLEHLVEDFLSYSCLVSGKETVNITKFNFNSLLTDIYKNISSE